MSFQIFRLSISAKGGISLQEACRQCLTTNGIPAAELSNSKVRRLVIAGMASINGIQERQPARRMKAGDLVAVKFDSSRFFREKQPDDIDFEMTQDRILFEDSSIIVVNKPACFPTEATIVADRKHLHAAVKEFLHRRDNTRNEPYAGLHHRLDRETSGVILFSKTREVNPAIHALFLEQRIHKVYTALTVVPVRACAYETQDRFVLSNNIDRITPKSSAGKWGVVQTGGDPAVTDFVVRNRRSCYLEVQASPLTGRTHQIRVHLSSVGLPLLGDVLYGGPKQSQGIPFDITRTMLHAETLSFPHPLTGELIEVTAPIPPDMQKILDLQ